MQPISFAPACKTSTVEVGKGCYASAVVRVGISVRVRVIDRIGAPVRVALGVMRLNRSRAENSANLAGSGASVSAGSASNGLGA